MLGEEHPDTLISISNLASTFLSQGWWKEAEELEEMMMEKKMRVLGKEHPDTLNRHEAGNHREVQQHLKAVFIKANNFKLNVEVRY